MTRAWGLEVDRVELAVEAVLQPPQDSLTVPSLDSTLQQLALHLLGGSMNSAVGHVPSPGPGLIPILPKWTIVVYLFWWPILRGNNLA